MIKVRFGSCMFRIRSINARGEKPTFPLVLVLVLCVLSPTPHTTPPTPRSSFPDARLEVHRLPLPSTVAAQGPIHLTRFPASMPEQPSTSSPPEIYELNRISPTYASWFLGDHVISNGSLTLATRMDALYPLLAVLMQTAPATGPFVPGDSLLDGNDHPVLEQCLQHAVREGTLRCICDARDVSDEAYFRLCPQRVTAWLSLKARQIAGYLSSEATYQGMSETARLAYAVAILGDYVDRVWIGPTRVHLGLPAEMNQGESALSDFVPSAVPGMGAGERGDPDEHSEKRQRLDPKEFQKAKAKAVREAARAEKEKKDIEKTRKEHKSIASFFAKKKA
jgi:hypothetical protein